MAVTFARALLPLILLSLPATGKARSSTEDITRLKFFENKIRPLLAAECYECHGEDKAKGGLRLDHIDLILEGGDTGPALVPGKPEESLLIEAVHRTNSDFEMPPQEGSDRCPGGFAGNLDRRRSDLAGRVLHRGGPR